MQSQKTSGKSNQKQISSLSFFGDHFRGWISRGTTLYDSTRRGGNRHIVNDGCFKKRPLHVEREKGRWK
jgi:hypothetical protein